MKNVKARIRKSLKAFRQELCVELQQHGNITSITQKLVKQIDDLLVQFFHNNLSQHNICLLALGSYGRRELQLYSDVDILLLHEPDASAELLEPVQAFVQDCWDIGLELSHQFTTVNDCAKLAATDISTLSSLMDMKLICGRSSLMEELSYKIHSSQMWPSRLFFEEKKAEQSRRYKKYNETAYNLEPNVKNGPGGLRDIQIILSVAKRQFNIKKMADGILNGFISDKEYEELLHCQHFLWKVRFALHYLAEKKEDRLLFDYQIKLAEFFGYKDQKHSLAIEQFMKSYFQIIKRIRELNEMLLQWFSEVILESERQRLTPLDAEFQLSNSYIEARSTHVFRNRPQALLTLFQWIARDQRITGVRAGTIRMIRQSLYLMNQAFKKNQIACDIFIDILKQPNPYRALHRMSRYGVLARYLDAYSSVTGQMQYDLFHVYTVDQHTLFVIRNINRFAREKFKPQFPLAYQLIQQISKPEILYLAALFHDIAKGRGGDHSELGADEAAFFAKRHELSAENSKLLCWLVKHHLLMSITAQRKDIYDPKTVDEFCAKLPEPHYLDYLYLLTVADICATNPGLWNAWKDSLLKELYKSASLHMQKKLQFLNEKDLINNRKETAKIMLINEGFTADAIETLWNSFKNKYFLHELPDIIARHTRAILNCKKFPLIIILPHHSQGGTEIFVYMPHKDERFVITTSVLANFNITIQEASILTSHDHFDIDTYIVLDEQDEAFFSKQKAIAVQKALEKQLSFNEIPKVFQKRISRTQAHFNVKPSIQFSDIDSSQTSLFLITTDRPGLLAKLSHVFYQLKINLHNAKIATAGERVEDTFYLSNSNSKALSEEEKNLLSKELIKKIGKN